MGWTVYLGLSALENLIRIALRMLRRCHLICPPWPSSVSILAYMNLKRDPVSRHYVLPDVIPPDMKADTDMQIQDLPAIRASWKGTLFSFRRYCSGMPIPQ
jgi:hypothetical protein